MKLLDFSSFKARYLFILVILVLVIILTIAISEDRIQSTAKILTNSISQRIEISKIVETLHIDLAKANRAIDLYMISPNKDSRDIMNKSFSNIRLNLSKLKQHHWITANLLPHSIIEFDKLIQNLENEASQLLYIRTNANKMYPSLVISNQTMLNSNRNLITLLTSAIQEKVNDHNIGTTQYLLLISIRDQWRRLINDYRVYLINRLGSLHEKNLLNLTSNIEINYNKIQTLTKKLTTDNDNTQIGLNTEILIDNISSLTKKWYKGYKKVYKINTSSNWRKDIPILSNQIYPMFKQANYDLEYISRKLHENSKSDLDIQKKSMASISYYLLTLALFVIGYITLTTLFLYKNLLHPIELLSKNLKLEAQGKPTEKIKNINTSEIKRIMNSFNEMQYQVHSRQVALEHLAMHDSLTGLPNRSLLMDRLNHAILNSKRNDTSISLLLLDLDRFKEINDSLGHAAGDILLCTVAERIKNCLRDSDTVARLGGDEFAIVLPNISASAVKQITKKLISTLDNVYHIEEHNLYVGMSIGIANFPNHGDDSSSLMQHADIAMYQSKRTNTNITTYDPEKDIQNIEKLSLLTDLKTALINNEMLLHYLPISSLATMKIIGFEALIRWQHPIYGIILPSNFINIAEQTGIIKNISRWVIKQAVAQCKIWQNLGEDVYVTINLSVWDLQDPSLEAYIKSILSEYHLPAHKLVLEITESAMMADSERAKEVLIKLHDMGLDITVDDYGTGFSSMAYLKQLPVDTLKIDKSFVKNMDTDENNETIVRSSIELAHNLGLLVLAEGVESNRIKDLLFDLKCDKIQGYLINKAITKESATKLLKQEKDNVSYLKPNK